MVARIHMLYDLRVYFYASKYVACLMGLVETQICFLQKFVVWIASCVTTLAITCGASRKKKKKSSISTKILIGDLNFLAMCLGKRENR